MEPKRAPKYGPISVIVPIYNGVPATRRLFDSIVSVYSAGTKVPMRLILIDDASPSEEVEPLLRDHAVTKLPFTEVYKNPVNLGFIGTVNRGFALAKNDDVIILNSDTEIYSDIALEFRTLADFDARIATITPMTTSGTIASVVKFPDGTDLPPFLEPADVHKSLRQLNLQPVIHEIPTGVGFCMYISRVALEKEGGFDPAFGKGYGEECDFCRRVAKHTFKNVLAPHIFVYHQGSQSFGSDVRLKLVAQNEKILTARHPEYNRVVAEYVQANPTRLIRFLALFNAMVEKVSPSKSIIHLAHADLKSPHAGGTERHVRQICEDLSDVLHVTLTAEQHFPDRYKISLWHKEFCETFDIDLNDAIFLLEKIRDRVSAIHIHHTRYVAREIVESLENAGSKILFTGHDYFLNCPAVNYLTGPKRDTFCGPERDPEVCNNCLIQFHKLHLDNAIERQQSARLLNRADVHFFPSELARDMFYRAQPEVANRSVILAHDLEHLKKISARNVETLQTKGLVIFLGAISMHKGAKSTTLAASELLRRGYRVEVWGAIDESESVLPKRCIVRGFDDLEGLKKLFSAHHPEFYVIPSIWPETFCYTFFEGLFLSDATPVVTNLIHPAHLVAQFKCGYVVPPNSADAITQTIVNADQGELMSRQREVLRTALLARPPWAQEYLVHVPIHKMVPVELPSYTERYYVGGHLQKLKELMFNVIVKQLKTLVRKNRFIYRFLLGVRGAVRKIRKFRENFR